MKQWHCVVSAALVVGALGACASYPPPTTPIRASESGATLPTFRISLSLDSAAGAPAEQGAGRAVELGVATGKGRDTQVLSAGQAPLVFGDTATTFSPPQSLAHEFDFAYYDVSWRMRGFRADQAAGFELLAGLGYLSTDLTVSSPSERASETLTSVNLTLGVGGLWRVRPTTLLHGRATFMAPLGDFDEVLRLEAHVVQALGRNAAVRAGYAFWRIRSEPSSTSGIKLDLSGPVLGLDLSF
jgi:hypothetical protein